MSREGSCVAVYVGTIKYSFNTLIQHKYTILFEDIRVLDRIHNDTTLELIEKPKK